MTRHPTNGNIFQLRGAKDVILFLEPRFSVPQIGGVKRDVPRGHYELVALFAFGVSHEFEEAAVGHGEIVAGEGHLCLYVYVSV